MVFIKLGGVVMEGVDYERHSADMLGDLDGPMHGVEEEIAGVALSSVPVIDGQLTQQCRR